MLDDHCFHCGCCCCCYCCSKLMHSVLRLQTKLLLLQQQLLLHCCSFPRLVACHCGHELVGGSSDHTRRAVSSCAHRAAPRRFCIPCMAHSDALCRPCRWASQ